MDTMMPGYSIPMVRLGHDAQTVVQELGLLGDLPGNWHGRGFNLIARPDKQGGGPLFLELNQTHETLKFDPIASSVPNRGFAQDDIELFGLTYLQKISDAVTGGALHIEPGIWVRQPPISAPPEQPPPGQEVVCRMGSIPHGNALLAQGSAILVPSLPGGTFQIKPVNTAPFKVGAPMRPPALKAASRPITSRTPAPPRSTSARRPAMRTRSRCRPRSIRCRCSR